MYICGPSILTYNWWNKSCGGVENGPFLYSPSFYCSNKRDEMAYLNVDQRKNTDNGNRIKSRAQWKCDDDSCCEEEQEHFTNGFPVLHLQVKLTRLINMLAPAVTLEHFFFLHLIHKFTCQSVDVADFFSRPPSLMYVYLTCLATDMKAKLHDVHVPDLVPLQT